MEDLTAYIRNNDLAAVVSIVQQAPVSSLRDAEGVTALHLAVLSNALEIAKVLIDVGSCAVNATTQVLCETPLFFSVRNGSHAMTELLIQRGANLTHVNSAGLDVLQLACKVENVNALYLLLSWGCIPRSTNQLIHDVIHTLPVFQRQQRSNVKNKALIRLLLKFSDGAPLTSSETPLHALAELAAVDELGLAFDLYQFQHLSHSQPPHIAKNAEGVTPYNLSVLSDNRQFSRFLFDALLFNLLPYHFPTLVTALCVVSMLIVMETHGMLFSMVYFVLLYTFATRSLIQFYIIKHRSRVFIGLGIGFVAVILASFCYYIYPHCSLACTVSGFMLTLATISLAIRCARTKPAALPCNLRSELEGKILRASAISGSGSAEDEGPILCTACLADQREATLHCSFCSACILGQDFHSLVLGVCIGQGNRRLFYTTMCCALMTLLHFSASIFWVHTHNVAPCHQDVGTILSIPSLELCVLWQEPASALLLCICLCICLSLFGLLWTAVALVVRRSTFSILTNKGIGFVGGASLSEAIHRFSVFLRTGDYDVAVGEVLVRHPGGGPVSCNSLVHGTFFGGTLAGAVVAKTADADPDIDAEANNLSDSTLLYANSHDMLLLHQSLGGADDERDEEDFGPWSFSRRNSRHNGHQHNHSHNNHQHQCRSCNKGPPVVEDAGASSEVISSSERS